jgi:xylan 1,4-beta-xylosidase
MSDDISADTDRGGLTRRQVVQAGGVAAAGALLGVGSARAASTGRAVADLTQPAVPFPHVWERVVGGDWAKQALRRDYQDQLLEAHRELGIRSLRFHGVLNTEMSVYAPSAGLPRPAPFTQDPYSFFNVDQIYDFLVENGMHPFVELSSMPEALQAKPPAFRVFLYRFNPTEPADYAAWGRLVRAFAKHLVDRYGIREVRTWPLEVWNEPNLPFFFEATSRRTSSSTERPRRPSRASTRACRWAARRRPPASSAWESRGRRDRGTCSSSCST